MEKYDYREMVRADIMHQISFSLDENDNYESFEEFANFYDYEYLEPDVTGSNIGSKFPYCSSIARECVLVNLELLEDMRLDFGISYEEIGKLMFDNRYEQLDVLIRRYVFYDVFVDGVHDAWEEYQDLKRI